MGKYSEFENRRQPWLHEPTFKGFNFPIPTDYHADISTSLDYDRLAIPNFEKSLKHDLEPLRSSLAVPQQVNLYGFFYEINSRKLTEVLRIFLH
jgi:hypothetical protein